MVAEELFVLNEKDLKELPIEETRRALLKNYHSNIQTHAGYLIALIVGVLAVFSRLDIFFGRSVFVSYAGWLFLFLMGGIIITGFWAILRIIYWTSYVNCCILLTNKELVYYFNKRNEKRRRYLLGEKALGTPPATTIIQWSIARMHEEGEVSMNKKIAMITTNGGYKWFVLVAIAIFAYIVLIGFALRL